MSRLEEEELTPPVDSPLMPMPLPPLSWPRPPSRPPETCSGSGNNGTAVLSVCQSLRVDDTKTVISEDDAPKRLL